MKTYQSEAINRRAFLERSLLACLTGVAITVAGCGRNDEPGASGQSSGGKSGAISSNHGHSAVITNAQLTDGSALQLDITGNSGHPHTVSLSATQVRAIGAGTQVSVVSTTDDGHNHTVTFN